MGLALETQTIDWRNLSAMIQPEEVVELEKMSTTQPISYGEFDQATRTDIQVAKALEAIRAEPVFADMQMPDGSYARLNIDDLFGPVSGPVSAVPQEKALLGYKTVEDQEPVDLDNVIVLFADPTRARLPVVEAGSIEEPSATDIPNATDMLEAVLIKDPSAMDLAEAIELPLYELPPLEYDDLEGKTMCMPVGRWKRQAQESSADEPMHEINFLPPTLAPKEYEEFPEPEMPINFLRDEFLRNTQYSHSIANLPAKTRSLAKLAYVIAQAAGYNHEQLNNIIKAAYKTGTLDYIGEDTQADTVALLYHTLKDLSNEDAQVGVAVLRQEVKKNIGNTPEDDVEQTIFEAQLLVVVDRYRSVLSELTKAYQVLPDVKKEAVGTQYHPFIASVEWLERDAQLHPAKYSGGIVYLLRKGIEKGLTKE